MQLRDYQTRTLNMIYDWLSKNDGNVVVNLPTGSGKSVVIAELCRQAVSQWPETRILMLTRSVELINQNTEKLMAVWPNAPVGIFSASVGKKETGKPITVGGPLSVVRSTKNIGPCQLLIVDECHDIGHNNEGSYRKIINDLLEMNQHMRVIGFSASPFRTGHGLITDKPAIFDAIIEPVTIEELIYKGYLARLQSKQTQLKLDTKGVHIRGGDYIESELQAAVNTKDNNESMIDEVIKRAQGRKSWMFFCAGVEHARNLRDLLLARNVSAVTVTGDMPKHEREKAINDFKTGKITAITQVGCLNVGFDHPDLDLLVMARPTMSPGLYLQQAGRGMRIKSHTDHCLVLDFAGVVATHGPITAVQPPRKGSKGTGEAPVKVCSYCQEIAHLAAKECPACGQPFPASAKPKLKLREDDIMGGGGKAMDVTGWVWSVKQSQRSGQNMLVVSYYGGLSDPVVREYLTVLYDGPAGVKARSTVSQYLLDCNVTPSTDLAETARRLNAAKPPMQIEYKMDGKYHRILRKKYESKAA